MNQPLVSIVIPCYNHENFVQDCIQSVIDQTYQNIELIIIDDGSNDGSVAKIEEMIDLCKKRFIHFEFRYRPNKGLSATLNEAIEWCQGEYYSVIASDDLILSFKIDIQVDFLLKNSNCVAVFGGVNLIDNNNKNIGEWLFKQKKYSFSDIFLHKHNLPAPTALMKTGVVKAVGGYKTEIMIEDWYMWLKLSKIGDIYYLPKILASYRFHDNNMSKNLHKMHLGRFQVIDYFKFENQYENARLNVEWINASEFLHVNKYDAIKAYMRIMIKAPLFFLYTLSNRLIKRI